MNKLKLTILFLFMSLAASAQRLAVESLQLRSNDLDARKNPHVDLNGKPCALLKVMVVDNITKCSSGNIGDIVTEGAVKLIYITSATPSIELSFQYHFPITINFADYGFKHLEGNSTYELKIVDAQQTTTATTNQHVSSGQNSNGDLNISIAEANLIAKTAFDAKDYSKALKYYRYGAVRNDSICQLMIGVMYLLGKGVTKDNTEAMKWLLKSANQGYASAQFNIGVMYNNGLGVEQDYSEAYKWYLKAAEQGHYVAQYNLGAFLYKGQGVAQNYKEAFNWWLKAANSGDSESQYNVGSLYERGEGVEKNIDNAVSWYKKGAGKGNTNCKNALKRLGY